MIVFSHTDCLRHDMGAGHPEQPARLHAVRKALTGSDFSDLIWRDAPQIDTELLTLVHHRHYIDSVLNVFPLSSQQYLDADTSIAPGSEGAILRSAGAAIAAVDAVQSGETTHAFCAVRPPGHHAEPDRSMGFCVFNNVALAARYSQKHYGLQRVAVVDFDVHHGNGTQRVSEQHADIFFASSHQIPLYPGTGGRDETGIDNNVVNVPLHPGSGSAEFRKAWDEHILPAVDDFAPELLLISAGFDAHREDPLGGLSLIEDDFYYVTQQLHVLAKSHCQGRVVSLLEGGYNLEALGRSAAAHVAAFLD